MGLRVMPLLALILAGGPASLATDTHPRIWLTSAALTTLRAKARAGDDDWRAVQASADRLLATRMPRFTVLSATNTNPLQLTIAEPIPWSGSTPVFIGGATGAWTPINTSGDRPRAIAASRVGAHTFTVPIDATPFGSFTGQRLALFFSDGGYSAYGYEGSEWQSMLEILGVAYQVTGNAAYATKGAELVDYIASLGVAGMLAPAAIDAGFPSRSAIYGL